MCLYPKLIKNPKYKENKKNGGNIPAVSDKRILSIPVGCGNCIVCRKQKARNWQYRIIEEVKKNTNGKFITLTFSETELSELYKEVQKNITKNIIGCKTKKDKNGKFKIRYIYENKAEEIRITGYELENKAATLGVRRFLERWRKKNKESPKHWLITELGHNGTERIHLHGIIWTDNIEEIVNNWKYGIIWKGKKINEIETNYVNGKTASYITKYVTKIDKIHPNYKSIILCSGGIGKNWANGKKTDYYRSETGHKIGLNTYWKNKMFTEEEREKKWIEMLDKNERWIGGIKYNGDEHEKILQALQRQRELNKELGYGSDKKEWNKEYYENQLREQNQIRLMKRI